jgi:hypothetical protein
MAQMALQNRAALALDMTHDKEMIGLQTKSARRLLAAWLDGEKLKITMVRKLVRYLESTSHYVAR